MSLLDCTNDPRQESFSRVCDAGSKFIRVTGPHRVGKSTLISNYFDPAGKFLYIDLTESNAVVYQAPASDSSLRVLILDNVENSSLEITAEICQRFDKIILVSSLRTSAWKLKYLHLSASILDFEAMPMSFLECQTLLKCPFEKGWRRFGLFGGFPIAFRDSLEEDSAHEAMIYMGKLWDKILINFVLNRCKSLNPSTMKDIVDYCLSKVAYPLTLKSMVSDLQISEATIRDVLVLLWEAFLFLPFQRAFYTICGYSKY